MSHPNIVCPVLRCSPTDTGCPTYSVVVILGDLIDYRVAEFVAREKGDVAAEEDFDIINAGGKWCSAQVGASQIVGDGGSAVIAPISSQHKEDRFFLTGI